MSSEILDLEGEQVSAQKFILATGSSPVMPQSWAQIPGVLTTNSIFELKELPKKIAVIGFGAIGLEISQALAKVGVDVTVFKKGDGVGSGLTDPEMTAYARQIFSKEMTLNDETVKDLKAAASGVLVQSERQEITVDQVLVAIGRKPNLSELGLENLGFPLDKQGIPVFSDRTFRIQSSNFYLAGDVNAERPLLHEAAEQGRIAGFNSVQDEDREFPLRVPLGITFSSPQIAQVGKSHRELKEKKIDFVEGSVSFETQGRAVAKLENKGLLKIYGDRQSGEILGAEIFAPEGEHLAHLLAWSLEAKCTVFELLLRPYYHPVIEEGLRTALRRLSRKVEKPCNEVDLIRCEDPPAGN